MEVRRTVERTVPAQPEHVQKVLVSDYRCDGCGVMMLDWNYLGGAHATEREGRMPRNKVMLMVNREHSPGDGEDDQRIVKDFCDDCFAVVVPALVTSMNYKEGS